jgi:hypothetical protein
MQFDLTEEETAVLRSIRAKFPGARQEFRRG